MKIKLAPHVFVLAGSLLALSSFAEDMSILRDETGALSHTRRNTETGELYEPGGISQTAPALETADYDQLPPTAAGSTAFGETADDAARECGW